MRPSSLAPILAPLVVLTVATAARADYLDEKPRSAHTYIDLRGGLVGISPLGQRDLRYGPAVEVSGGAAWTWLDLGLVGRVGSIPAPLGREPYVAFGAEAAGRLWLGGPTTFRYGFVPLYAVAWQPQGEARGRFGVDAIAQLLFTVHDQSRPFFRMGVGLRGGRWWSASPGEATWTVGLDLLMRTWW